MSDENVIQLPPKEGPPEFMIGPFSEHRVIIEGRVIPRLTAFHDGEGIGLVVDGRFGVTFPKEHAYGAAWLIANALAIGAGYSSMNADNKNHPFAPIGCEIKLP